MDASQVHYSTVRHQTLLRVGKVCHTYKTLNNIGEVNNLRKQRISHKTEGVDQSERTKLKERRLQYDGCSVEFYRYQTDADHVF